MGDSDHNRSERAASDIMLRRPLSRERIRRAIDDEVEQTRGLLADGRTLRAIEWLLESGQLDD